MCSALCPGAPGFGPPARPPGGICSVSFTSAPDSSSSADHLHLAFADRQQQRRHSGIEANFEIRSGLDQLPRRLDIAFRRGPNDRGLPAHFLRVNQRAFREQRAHRGGFSGPRRRHQRRFAAG